MSSAILWLLGGLVAGAGLMWLWLRGTIQALQAERDALRQQPQQLRDGFVGLAAEALRDQLEDFQQRANANLTTPLLQSFDSLRRQISELHQAQAAGSENLHTHLLQLQQVQNTLRQETERLRETMRNPAVRGRWGELQLRRCVELAGMVAHVDFIEQPQLADGSKRPDLLVHLPGERQIYVDAKVPMSSYLAALEASGEEQRQAHLLDHARQIRQHITSLARRDYAGPHGPDFVVLFLPDEGMYGLALGADPGLIEFGPEQKILLATPTTLISLLKAAHYGWRQERLAVDAEQLRVLGQEFMARLTTFLDHLGRTGKAINGAAEAFNQTLASLESRLLPKARQLQEQGLVAIKPENLMVKNIETQTRPPLRAIGDE